jgi:hypothetical protein
MVDSYGFINASNHEGESVLCRTFEFSDARALLHERFEDGVDVHAIPSI